MAGGRVIVVFLAQLPQHDSARGQARLDPALHLAFGDSVEHFGIRRRRLCPEVPVVGRQIAEIFGDRLHGRERVVETFQRAGKGPV
jgi:hypothetical protein